MQIKKTDKTNFEALVRVKTQNFHVLETLKEIAHCPPSLSKERPVGGIMLREDYSQPPFRPEKDGFFHGALLDEEERNLQISIADLNSRNFKSELPSIKVREVFKPLIDNTEEVVISSLEELSKLPIMKGINVNRPFRDVLPAENPQRLFYEV